MDMGSRMAEGQKKHTKTLLKTCLKPPGEQKKMEPGEEGNILRENPEFSTLKGINVREKAQIFPEI